MFQSLTVCSKFNIIKEFLTIIEVYENLLQTVNGHLLYEYVVLPNFNLMLNKMTNFCKYLNFKFRNQRIQKIFLNS